MGVSHTKPLYGFVEHNSKQSQEQVHCGGITVRLCQTKVLCYIGCNEVSNRPVEPNT